MKSFRPSLVAAAGVAVFSFIGVGFAHAACPADMVSVNATGTCIDRYEASKLDATAVSAGSDNSRAVSQAGVIPWTNLTFSEASQACQNSAKRLCESEEWRWGCVGDSKYIFPYGNTFGPIKCNAGERYNYQVKPTGSEAQCVGGYPLLADMSGNVSEWLNGTVVNERPYRGGSYLQPMSGDFQRCSDGGQLSDNYKSPGMGFRCCTGVPTIPSFYSVCYCSIGSVCCDGCNPINEGTVCSDGSANTTGDVCKSGSCVGSCICAVSNFCCNGCGPQNTGYGCDAANPTKVCQNGACVFP